MRYGMALLLAGLSGWAALSHELLWSRRLIDLLGASTQSNTLVFECFFLGLALGYACSTGLARRPWRPWRVVALIEVGIALLSVPALTLAGWTGWIWPWLGPDRLVGGYGAIVKLTVAVLIMVPPAVLMGMTLPLMAKAILEGDRTLGRQGVWLYAVNTFGGVVGLLWTTAVMLPWLGVAGSMGAAAGANLVVAGLCVWMDHFQQEATIGRQERKADEESGIDTARIPWVMLAMSFASGAGVLGVEVLCMHLFMQVAPSAIHAVAAVLGAIIGLLAVSAFVVPLITPRLGSARGLLRPVLMLTGLATAWSPLLFMWVTNQMVTIQPSSTMLGFILKMTGYVLVSIGPGIFLAGLVLPLVFSWFSAEGGGRHGRRWGWLLAVNGVGGVVGAEVAQRLVMPVVGMHGALGVFGLGYAALAGVMILHQDGWRAFRGPVWRPIGVMVMIGILAVGWLLRLPLIHPTPTQEIRFKTLAISAGPEGVVAVTDSDELGRGIVMFNQYVLGSTAGMADEQRQAHLPIMLHPQPRRVAFIGLATGITAGAALVHDDVESVTAIELSELVAESCKNYFSEFTNDIFGDERAEVVVEDGRTYIASCVDQYDVIMGDLFLPWRPGVGRLYSVEHFHAVRRALRSGGLFCQMLPMYQFSRDQQEVVTATFLQVFPRAHLFRLGFDIGMPVLAIVGIKDADLDWQGLEARCEELRNSRRIGDPVIRHPEGIAMLYLGAIRTADLAGQRVNTLGNAWVELNSAKDFVTDRWSGEYFMNNQRWLELVDKRVEKVDVQQPDSSQSAKWMRLGNQITRWCYLRDHQSSTSPNRLGTIIRDALPHSMKNDPQIDRTAWPRLAPLLER